MAIRPWTDTETHLIVQMYPTKGIAGCVAVLPGRSDAAIKQRACRLELTEKQKPEVAVPVAAHDPYTPEHYAMRNWRDCGAIVARSQLMGVI